MKLSNTVLIVGCHVSGLGSIRALGGHGITIVAMSYENTDFGQYSKYVSERVTIPHPRLEEEQFIDYLVDNGHKWNGAMILATDDNGAVSLAKHKARLSSYYRVSTAEWELLRKFIEKKETYLLSKEAGIPHPTTFLPKTADDADTIKDNITYPCILKPVKGHEFFERFKVKNFTVLNPEELTSKLKHCFDTNQEVMVQEIIDGPETNLYKMQAYINSNGVMTAKFFWKKLRQHPPMFGVGRVGVSTERHEEVEQLAEKLMHTANYRGYFSIEFKHDPRDNQLKLMEVNTRMPRNSVLATASGVNFPLIMFMDLVENKQTEMVEYIRNMYWIEILLDVYNILFKRNVEKFTIREYLRPYFAKQKAFAIFSLSDFMPFFMQIIVIVKRAIRKLLPWSD